MGEVIEITRALREVKVAMEEVKDELVKINIREDARDLAAATPTP